MAGGRRSGSKTLGGKKLTGKQRAFWLMIGFVMLFIYFILISVAWSR